MPVRTAVFCNDTWHPAEKIRKGLSPLARGDFLFDWLETPEQWSQTPLRNHDFIVLAKGNTTAPGDQSPWLSPELENEFVQHVRNGKGIFVLHGGCCYRDNAKLRAICGGAFLRHPPPSPLTTEPRIGHPLTDGVQKATFRDEHYEVIIDDPKAEIFLHTRSEHGVQPAGWTRLDTGRVCALTPGHTDEAWKEPQFLRLIDNCLRWTAGIS